jgi:hypothetical protein
MASVFDEKACRPMPDLPKLTKRAAEEIARREADYRRHLPAGNYLSFIGCEIEVEPDYPPDPPIRPHYFFSDAAGVPEEYQVECHGVRVAYATRERILARLGPCLLDFDGERFTFVTRDGAEEP